MAMAKKAFIPLDVVQIMMEYLLNFAAVIRCRAVSLRWHATVAKTLVFLNSKNCKSLHSRTYSARYSIAADPATKLGVLAFGAGLKELTIMDASVTDADMAIIGAQCSVLEMLVVGRCASLHRLTLQLLPNLRFLRLTANANLSLLTNGIGAEKLHTIEVTDCNVFREANLKAICELRELATLDLRGCPLMTNVACLSSCQRLTSLAMDRTPMTNTIIAVAKRCTALTALSLKDCRGVTDLRELKDCPGLQVLNATGTRVDQTGINGLQRAPVLATLRLARTRVMDISCLVSSTSLTELDLSETSLGDGEIRCLARMPQLRMLQLSHCSLVTDVRALTASTSIARLFLQHSRVSNQGIAGLENMPSLCELLVSSTAVTDVRQFAQRSPPWRLVVDRNTLKDNGQVGVCVV
jgi:Leucine-rich repeat (LRR) protein